MESPETLPPGYARRVVKNRTSNSMAWLAAISVGFAILGFAVAANASGDEFLGAAASLLGLGSALLAAVFVVIYNRRFTREVMAQAEPPKGLRLWAMPICCLTVVALGLMALVVWTQVTPVRVLSVAGISLATFLLLALLDWGTRRLRQRRAVQP